MTAVQVSAKPPMAVESGVNVQRLMEQALQQGEPGVAALERLMKLDADLRAEHARREFFGALATFQQECPSIPKTATVDYVSTKGGRVRYTYAPLDGIVAHIRPLLHQHGLSYTWDTKADGKMLHVTCTLRHQNGHEQTATFSVPVDGQAAMSEPQKYASTLTFARRYSLVQVLGLAMTDPDEDAAGGPTITAEDVADLRKAAAEAQLSAQRLFRLLSVGGSPILDWDALVGQPEALYHVALNAINEKRRQMEAKQ